MYEISLADALRIQTNDHPVVVISNTLQGMKTPRSFKFDACTSPASSLFMSRWCPMDRHNADVRDLRIPRTMARRALARFVSHIQRVATSAACWGVCFEGVVTLLLPGGKISKITVNGSNVVVGGETQRLLASDCAA